MMKGFRLSIAQGHFYSCDLIPTIIHPCGIQLLAQARPKMPCIYTSINCIVLYLVNHRCSLDVQTSVPLAGHRVMDSVLYSL